MSAPPEKRRGIENRVRLYIDSQRTPEDALKLYSHLIGPYFSLRMKGYSHYDLTGVLLEYYVK